jgi:hypothetical protein
MDISVVTGDASETQNHSCEKYESQNQEDRNRVTKAGSGLGMIENPAKTRNAPKKTEANWYSPEHQVSTVTTGIWGRRCLS